MKNFVAVFGRIVTALTMICSASSSRGSDPAECCLELPGAPNNEADGIVKVTWGGPVGGPGFGNGLPPEFSLFTIDVLAGGGMTPTPPVPPGRYAGWCFDADTDISPAPGGTLYGARLYSSCDPDASFNQFLPNHPNVKKDAVHWKKINYLIKSPFFGLQRSGSDDVGGAAGNLPPVRASTAANAAVSPLKTGGRSVPGR